MRTPGPLSRTLCFVTIGKRRGKKRGVETLTGKGRGPRDLNRKKRTFGQARALWKLRGKELVNRLPSGGGLDRESNGNTRGEKVDRKKRTGKRIGPRTPGPDRFFRGSG